MGSAKNPSLEPESTICSMRIRKKGRRGCEGGRRGRRKIYVGDEKQNGCHAAELPRRNQSLFLISCEISKGGNGARGLQTEKKLPKRSEGKIITPRRSSTRSRKKIRSEKLRPTKTPGTCGGVLYGQENAGRCSAQMGNDEEQRWAEPNGSKRGLATTVGKIVSAQGQEPCPKEVGPIGWSVGRGLRETKKSCEERKISQGDTALKLGKSTIPTVSKYGWGCSLTKRKK